MAKPVRINYISVSGDHLSRTTCVEHFALFVDDIASNTTATLRKTPLSCDYCSGHTHSHLDSPTVSEDEHWGLSGL